MEAPPTRYLWFFLILLLALAADFGGLLAALFLGMAFIPALLYMNWFRNLEKHDPEPWGALYQAFFWGAITGIIAAGLIVFNKGEVKNLTTAAHIWLAAQRPVIRSSNLPMRGLSGVSCSHTPTVAPHSSSSTITSWQTSISRRVR